MINYYPIEFDATGSRFTMINSGTAPAPCVITIIPRVDLLNIAITGLTSEPIQLTNIYADDVLVIDGENRTVLVNDEEAFEKYNAWEFPKLQPGINEIQITNGSQAQVSIEYDIRYI